MPNTPISLQRPPPTAKGTTSEATLLQTLPDVNTTVQGMATMWLLSKQSSDFVRVCARESEPDPARLPSDQWLLFLQAHLGHYPEEHFCEEVPLKLIDVFQGELEVLSAVIKTRNKGLEIPCTYLDPAVLENSVAI